MQRPGRPGWRVWLDGGSIPSQVIKEIEPVFWELADDIEEYSYHSPAQAAHLVNAFEEAIATFIEAVMNDTIGNLTSASLFAGHVLNEMPVDLPIDLTNSLPRLPSPWHWTVILTPYTNSSEGQDE